MISNIDDDFAKYEKPNSMNPDINLNIKDNATINKRPHKQEKPHTLIESEVHYIVSNFN